MIHKLKFANIYSKIVNDESINIAFDRVYCIFRAELIKQLFSVNGKFCTSGTYYYKVREFKIRISNHPNYGYIDRPTLSIVLINKKLWANKANMKHKKLYEVFINISAIKNKDLMEGKSMLRKATKEINDAINDFLLHYKLLTKDVSASDKRK